MRAIGLVVRTIPLDTRTFRHEADAIARRSSARVRCDRGRLNARYHHRRGAVCAMASEVGALAPSTPCTTRRTRARRTSIGCDFSPVRRTSSAARAGVLYGRRQIVDTLDIPSWSGTRGRTGAARDGTQNHGGHRRRGRGGGLSREHRLRGHAHESDGVFGVRAFASLLHGSVRLVARASGEGLTRRQTGAGDDLQVAAGVLRVRFHAVILLCVATRRKSSRAHLFPWRIRIEWRLRKDGRPSDSASRHETQLLSRRCGVLRPRRRECVGSSQEFAKANGDEGCRLGMTGRRDRFPCLSSCLLSSFHRFLPRHSASSRRRQKASRTSAQGLHSTRVYPQSYTSPSSAR